ncbi:hypothetical protein I6J18_19355 [Peribacillus psychrosaccharolyticus]|uniref:RNA polymerase subunit sigma-70 n=1 Tax=Peribacillus psychrosaccharolyticus TaxID=1407 RepID=A0A974RZR6_PERPY|nr:hypothetical protein [Peribacillus psychrosaccharolyticus]MEC2054537.1 hypothetical protein [Peribacillus psychrosaccharolyticus]MED3744236.1 hypothetical protein [Peribacillus psychrosaccharolyticus]QQS99723.1 hypothetical protein I6J18_19355 [Peribacillus psychrosaccharolyticus]
MKFSEKNQTSVKGVNQLLGVDFHDFIQREQGDSSTIELASEFGLTFREVNKLKKKIGGR